MKRSKRLLFLVMALTLPVPAFAPIPARDVSRNTAGLTAFIDGHVQTGCDFAKQVALPIHDESGVRMGRKQDSAFPTSAPMLSIICTPPPNIPWTSPSGWEATSGPQRKSTAGLWRPL